MIDQETELSSKTSEVYVHTRPKAPRSMLTASRRRQSRGAAPSHRLAQSLLGAACRCHRRLAPSRRVLSLHRAAFPSPRGLRRRWVLQRPWTGGTSSYTSPSCCYLGSQRSLRTSP